VILTTLLEKHTGPRRHDKAYACEVPTVFEDGLRGIPLSIDLWVHYINTMTSVLELDPDKEAKIRMLYDRAIIAAGTDFRSDKLWEMYINWEKENKNIKRVTQLFDRIITIPTQLYSHHFENYTLHIREHHPKELLSLDEFLKMRKEVVSSHTKPGDDDDDADNAAPPGMDDAPPGMEAEKPPGADDAIQIEDSEVPALREKIIEVKTAIHKQNEQEVSKRWAFEEAIRRPYFHVKPLEKIQLRNWKDYLDFEIENGSHERAVVLFERCMIACALYEEFWMKYASYMEAHSTEGVRIVYQRACTIHLPKKPSIHLAWSAFEEQQGNINGALEILTQLEESVPGLVMVSLRCIGLQRRRGDLNAVMALYSKYAESATSTEVGSFFAIKFARYLSKVVGDFDKARSVLQSALEKDQTNAKLLLQLLDLEYQQPRVNEDSVLSVFDKAIENTELSAEHRIAFSQRKLEFLEDFGSNVLKVSKGYSDHQALTKDLQSKKRKSPEEETVEDESNKKAKTEAQVVNGDPTAAAVQNAAAAATSTAAAGTYDASQYNYNQSWSGYPSNYNYGAGWGYGYYGSQ